MLPPNIVYISGKTQYDALENPGNPLNSEARDEVVDAAWYRDMIEILMPPIEPKEGPLEPWVAETIYPVIDEEEEGAPRRPKFLGIFATLEDFVEAFTADPPEIPNIIDCFIVHSDYLVELIDEVTVKAGRDTIYGYLRDIMETTPLFVVQASVNAEQFSMYQDAMNELSDYLINAQVDLGVYPYPIEWTTYDKENPEAEWDFYPGHVIASNFYKAILEYIDRAPEKNDAFLAFQGLLVYRTDTELASIQGEISPDEQHINGSPYIGRCITITSKKGGTGKTTTSLGLANALAKYSQKAVEEGRAKTPLKIIVIDLDLQDGQVGYDTGNQAKTVVGIFDDFRSEYRILGEDPAEDWRIINDNINHNTRVGVDTLLAPENPTDLNDLRPPFYRTIIQAIREHYDIVIITQRPLHERMCIPPNPQAVLRDTATLQAANHHETTVCVRSRLRTTRRRNGPAPHQCIRKRRRRRRYRQSRLGSITPRSARLLRRRNRSAHRRTIPTQESTRRNQPAPTRRIRLPTRKRRIPRRYGSATIRHY